MRTGRSHLRQPRTRAPQLRPTEANTDGFDFSARSQLGNRPLDLATNSPGTMGSLYHEPAAGVNVAVRVAKDELQLGAADFNA